MATQPIPDNEEPSFGKAKALDLFDGAPTIIIFDNNHYLSNPPTDLKPFHRIVMIINDENILRHNLVNLNRSFTVVPILPQWNNPRVQTFVQENLLIYPLVNNFCLFFIDGQTNDLTPLYGNQLIGCHSITSRISVETRIVCADVNDLYINFCEQRRVQNHGIREIGVANVYVMEKDRRLSLQLTFNEQLQRELDE